MVSLIFFHKGFSYDVSYMNGKEGSDYSFLSVFWSLLAGHKSPYLETEALGGLIYFIPGSCGRAYHVKVYM